MGALVPQHQPLLRQCVAQSEHCVIGTDDARRALFRIVRGVSISSDSREAVDERVRGGHKRTASLIDANGGSSDCQVSAMGVFPHDFLALERMADEPGSADNYPDNCNDRWLAGDRLVLCMSLRRFPSHALRLGGWNGRHKDIDQAHREGTIGRCGVKIVEEVIGHRQARFCLGHDFAELGRRRVNLRAYVKGVTRREVSKSPTFGIFVTSRGERIDRATLSR